MLQIIYNSMFGIEPTIHRRLIDRVRKFIITKSIAKPDKVIDEVLILNEELSNSYKQYLSTKKELEECIKQYRHQHSELGKLIREKSRKREMSKQNCTTDNTVVQK